MFEFSIKDIKSRKEQFKIIDDWKNSEDCKRLRHLETLILKTYESVNFKAYLMGTRLDESFTREDYLEDFKVFFKPEIFNKLKDWCKEYEMLCEKENKVFDNL